MFSTGTGAAAVVPINETSLDHAREHLGSLDFSLNVSSVVYNDDSLIIGIAYENLTTYTTYFVSSDHFVTDAEGNRTQVAQYTGAIGSYDLSPRNFPLSFIKMVRIYSR